MCSSLVAHAKPDRQFSRDQLNAVLNFVATEVEIPLD